MFSLYNPSQPFTPAGGGLVVVAKVDRLLTEFTARSDTVL
jgi:hypothetical protein